MKSFLRKSLIWVIALAATFNVAKADKGMWLLHALTNGNWEQMKALGFNLSSDELYNPGQPSIASSVVIFGRGCTGVTASNQGLIMTNHHCGFGSIQKVSSVDHDYLQDGFVSQSFAEELPIEGLTVKYLYSVKDVTAQIEAEANKAKDEVERIKIVEETSAKIVKDEEARLNDEFKQVILEPFYAGNKFYLITYTVFKDVRLVFTAPSSVGKFGGDTDNWMWPRHTGDFSVFRVYADKDNKPAKYDKSNKPYTPIASATVSKNGIQEGDYAMTIGFPGSTQRYIPSFGIESLMQNENNPRIEVRGAKQEIWKKAMNADQATRIKYASKYAQSANYWKNSIGMNRGIKKLHVLDRKREEEARFQKWADAEPSRKAIYGNVLADMKKAYAESGDASRQLTYLFEGLYSGIEVVQLGNLAYALAFAQDGKAITKTKEDLNKIYKDYLPEMDRKVLPVVLNILKKNLSKELVEVIFNEVGGNSQEAINNYVNNIFDNSIIVDQARLYAAAEEGTLASALEADPAVSLLRAFFVAYRQLAGATEVAEVKINKGNRLYFAGRQLQDPARLMPSDANFTMRMSYGKVGGYEPQDGAYYHHFTTSKGLLQKYVPKDTEFDLKPDFLNLIKKGDFGQWADKDGQLHIAFLSNNDITGGNSGSPVFDKNGCLIGLAFDGNWEAMSGDIEFEPELQRTISVDIRYVLFVIDKWGKCPRLIEELKFYEGSNDKSLWQKFVDLF